MRTIVYMFLITLILLLNSCNDNDKFYFELAYRYAPIHYQDTDDSNYKADYLTRFDYDQNWEGADNWDNLGSGDLSASVYYSVVETETHWFIVYAFFHPRDWEDFTGQEHENDFEGILTIIKKNESEYGSLEGMITVFHTDFYSYKSPSSTLTKGHEDIDGKISFCKYDGVLHPKTCQQAKGHGIKVWPHTGDFTGSNNQDGIIYFPSRTISSVPSSGNDRLVYYKLVDLNAFGNLWTIQLSEANLESDQSKTFSSWGSLKGDKSGGCGGGSLKICSTNAANTPWGWDDSDDGSSYRGEFALDPAAIVDHYFNGLGNFSYKYVRNRYLSDLKAQGYNQDHLPSGWPENLNIENMYSKLY